MKTARRWRRRLFVAVVVAFGVGTVLLAWSGWWSDAWQVRWVAPSHVAPSHIDEGGQRPIEVHVTHRRSGRPWRGTPLFASARIAAFPAVWPRNFGQEDDVDPAMEDGRPSPWSEARPLDADGRAELSLPAHFLARVPGFFYTLRLSD